MARQRETVAGTVGKIAQQTDGTRAMDARATHLAEEIIEISDDSSGDAVTDPEPAMSGWMRNSWRSRFRIDAGSGLQLGCLRGSMATRSRKSTSAVMASRSSRKLPGLSWSPRLSQPAWGRGGNTTEVEAEALRNRVEELEALLGVGNHDVSRLMTVLDATPQQCEMVGFMLRRSVATRTALHTVVFGRRPECDQPEIKLIDVQMVNVRKALEKVGVEVRTEWGSGAWAIAGGQGEAPAPDGGRG
jgi:hypothetical protein